jgi:hypothetical protein
VLPCANCKGFGTSLRLAPVQKHSQGPKQVAGVPPLHAICEEWHSIIAEPESQVVFTGPLAMRPFPAIVFLRAFVENSTALSCVKLLPTAATLVQSAACAVTESAHTATAATKPNLKICIATPVKFKATLTLVDCLAVAKCALRGEKPTMGLSPSRLDGTSAEASSIGMACFPASPRSMA